LSGNKVASKRFNADEVYSISIDNLPQGLYLYKIIVNKEIKKQGKISLIKN
jgi:hypothetical protein